MSRRVSISLRTARDLLTVLCDVGFSGRPTVEELRAAMAPKRSVGASRVRRVAKKATKKEKRASVREAVMARAAERCECCGMPGVTDLELDHFWGRGREESVESCWALARLHHLGKTNSVPDRETWLRKFAAHASRHGYASQKKRALAAIESEELVSRAASMTRGAQP